MDYLISQVNERVRSDPAEFTAECDRAYLERIDSVASAICDNMAASPIVLLSGPSGSGKTTSAHNLELALERRGVEAHTISFDNYFKTMDPATAPLTPDGEPDYESPNCVDAELVNRHFAMLARGEEILIPHFEFAYQRRSDTVVTPMRLGKDEVAIFEGIHAFSDAVTEQNPQAFNLFVSPISAAVDGEGYRFRPTWVRMMRRMIRDHLFRGADAAFTLHLWKNVVVAENIHIFPFRYKADGEIDSAFPYEIPVLRSYALELLREIPAEDYTAIELEKAMLGCGRFADLDAAYVAPDAMLREFIGRAGLDADFSL